MRLDDARVLQVAREVSEQEEFARHRALSAQAVHELFKTLYDWLHNLEGLYSTDPETFWLLTTGLSLLLLLLIGHIVWTVRHALRPPPPTKPWKSTVEQRDLAAEAHRLAKKGSHLDAAHYLLLAALELLAHKRLLVLRRHDSNRRICQALSQASLREELRRSLVDLIRETDAAWFGTREGGQALYERWSRALGELRRAA